LPLGEIRKDLNTGSLMRGRHWLVGTPMQDGSETITKKKKKKKKKKKNKKLPHVGGISTLAKSRSCSPQLLRKGRVSNPGQSTYEARNSEGSDEANSGGFRREGASNNRGHDGESNVNRRAKVVRVWASQKLLQSGKAANAAHTERSSFTDFKCGQVKG